MQDERDLTTRKVSFAWLLSFYAPLLTENQREIARLYAEEDLSLTEIAEQFSVSRQSVYDTVSRVEKQMADMEKKLGLGRQFARIEATVTKCLTLLALDTPGAEALSAARTLLKNLLEEEENDGL